MKLGNEVLGYLRTQTELKTRRAISEGMSIGIISAVNAVKALEREGFVEVFDLGVGTKKLWAYKVTEKKGRFFPSDRRPKVLKKVIYRVIRKNENISFSEICQKLPKLKRAEIQTKVANMVKSEELVSSVGHTSKKKTLYKINRNTRAEQVKSAEGVNVHHIFHNAFAALYYGAKKKRVTA